MRTLISPWTLRTRRGRTGYWLVFALVIALFTIAFVVPLVWMLQIGRAHV